MSQMDKKDKVLLKEIKRIKKLQKGLYKEYEIPGIEDGAEELPEEEE